MNRELYMYEAINEALRQLLEADHHVVLLGEDIGQMGGAFWVTRGLQDAFGKDRVIDTPISEAGFLGMSVGMAMGGLRPIVEIQMIDFALLGMDAIGNHMAKLSYMSGGQIRLPIVIRAPIGGYYGDAAQQSQVLYGIFAHFPGLKVLVPSDPFDAKGLLLQAAREDSPVLFLEHKQLYGVPFMAYGTRGPVPEEPYTVPIGKAKVAREGRDVTVVSVGYGVHLALEAAEHAKEFGADVEVIDLRSLKPLDAEAVRTSALKSRRVVVVDEDYRSYGLSGEIAAVLEEDNATRTAMQAFARVANPDVPVPFSEPLEQAVLPSADRILDAIKELM
ncbi:MAG: alpha-ketoacid dehydrogenase subunit beta [Nitrososphaerales archaeon]|nr:alpha-ketoacid dehydrogenase subunit beta [Nitrososphaerales archaeon]